MVFAWQGFCFEHPDDWLPVNLTGNRQEGYARISSPADALLQLRWKSSKGKPSADAVGAYLDRLAKEAQRGKKPFERRVEPEESSVSYSYHSENWGAGKLFRATEEGRVYFVEIVGPSRSKLADVFKRALRTFAEPIEQQERWSLLGLDVLLPSGMKLESHELKAGKTALSFSGPRLKVQAQRWGFAEQLLQKHDFADWARAVSGLKSSKATVTDEGVELTGNRHLLGTVTVLAKHQTMQNQITVLRVEGRGEAEKPQWSWFV
ncbi:MAG TPA: hypothetical protein VG944_22465 [Fimbriimonas sp.]|nr:hypothetical protein [Fimbriimonas sp.]